MPEMAALASGCPHVVVDDEGTAYCALAEAQGQEAAAARQRLTTLELLLDTMKTEINGIPWRDFVDKAERMTSEAL